jgi:hypothetical protein
LSDDLDPPRLVDSNEIPDELRRGLEGLRGHVPSGAQLATIENRLGVEHAAAPSAAAPGSAVVAKALVGVGIAVGGAGLLWFLRSGSPGPTSTAEKPSAAMAVPSVAVEDTTNAPGGVTPGNGAVRPSATEPLTGGSERERTPEAPAGSGHGRASDQGEPGARNERSAPSTASGTDTLDRSAKSEATARAPSKTVTPSGVASNVQETPKSGESEIALLRDARATLAVDPAEALAITERHRSAYPRGSLGQEREIIAITALVKLGRTDAAQKRAEQFREAHPTSAYLVQLERILPK